MLNKIKGFSLLETFVSVALLSAAGTGASGIYDNYSTKQEVAKVDAAAQTVIQALSQYRTEHKNMPKQLSELALNDNLTTDTPVTEIKYSHNSSGTFVTFLLRDEIEVKSHITYHLTEQGDALTHNCKWSSLNRSLLPESCGPKV